MNDETFIIAARNKIRFDSPKGQLSVEDLFDLPLTSNTGKANLDDIAKGLHRKLKEDTEESFVMKKPKENTALQTGFTIVKYVIEVKLAEREMAANEADRAATRQKIMAYIEKKQDAALGEKSVEELMALLGSL